MCFMGSIATAGVVGVRRATVVHMHWERPRAWAARPLLPRCIPLTAQQRPPFAGGGAALRTRRVIFGPFPPRNTVLLPCRAGGALRGAGPH